MFKDALVPAVPPLHIALRQGGRQAFGQGHATHLTHPAVHVDGHLRSGRPVSRLGRVLPEVTQASNGKITLKLQKVETMAIKSYHLL